MSRVPKKVCCNIDGIRFKNSSKNVPEWTLKQWIGSVVMAIIGLAFFWAFIVGMYAIFPVTY